MSNEIDKFKIVKLFKPKTYGEYYHHIDSGGITISVKDHSEPLKPDESPDERLPVLQFEYSHFGNSSCISCWEFEPSDLRKMAKALITAADALSKKKRK
jgi:hypothetical protein